MLLRASTHVPCSPTPTSLYGDAQTGTRDNGCDGFVEACMRAYRSCHHVWYVLARGKSRRGELTRNTQPKHQPINFFPLQIDPHTTLRPFSLRLHRQQYSRPTIVEHAKHLLHIVCNPRPKRQKITQKIRSKTDPLFPPPRLHPGFATPKTSLPPCFARNPTDTRVRNPPTHGARFSDGASSEGQETRNYIYVPKTYRRVGIHTYVREKKNSAGRGKPKTKSEESRRTSC